MRALLLLALALCGCGASWTADDLAANRVGVIAESRVLDLCGGDAGGCTPSRVRAFTRLAYCANARELTAHGSPPDGGTACQSK